MKKKVRDSQPLSASPKATDPITPKSRVAAKASTTPRKVKKVKKVTEVNYWPVRNEKKRERKFWRGINKEFRQAKKKK